MYIFYYKLVSSLTMAIQTKDEALLLQVIQFIIPLTIHSDLFINIEEINK